MKIAIDLTQSEYRESELLEKILKNDFNKKINFIFIGNKKKPNKKIFFIRAKSKIEKKENPLLAVRKKKDCPIHIGINLLKNKEADAFISCASTAALMSCSKMLLNSFLKRPALLVLMPSKKNKNSFAVLDVGANLSKKSNILTEFAFLGSAFQKTRNIKKPVVGLLNIGSEEKKGTEELRKTYFELKELSQKYNLFTFAGNIEGKEVFEGNIDVLVTDGFTGNVFLKTSEGIANMVLEKIVQSKEKFSTFTSYLKNHLHYEKYRGAILLGLDELVIKCHGYSSPTSFISAIKGACDLVENNTIVSIKKILSPIKIF